MFILLEYRYAERWCFIRKKNLFSQDFRLRFSHFLWCHMDNVIIYIWCVPWKRFRLYRKPKKCNCCSDFFPAAVYTDVFNAVKNFQCKYISPVSFGYFKMCIISRTLELMSLTDSPKYCWTINHVEQWFNKKDSLLNG